MQVPSFGFGVRQLQKRELLPAIVFVFSRKGCDAAAEEVGGTRVSLYISSGRILYICVRICDAAAEVGGTGVSLDISSGRILYICVRMPLYMCPHTYCCMCLMGGGGSCVSLVREAKLIYS
jgi:hypothetical protein